MITVEHALDLGRQVFAVPGPVTSPLSEVPLALIREGAVLIRGTDDLLDDLGLIAAARRRRTAPGCPTTSAACVEQLAGPSLPDAVARTPASRSPRRWRR